MFRRIDQGTSFRLLKNAAPAALATMLGWSAMAQTQAPAKPVPDAQVEASVLKALAGASDLANQPLLPERVDDFRHGLFRQTGHLGKVRPRDGATV